MGWQDAPPAAKWQTAPKGKPSTATASARSIANGVTAGFMDKIAAGLDSVIPLNKLTNSKVKSVWETGDLGTAYSNNLALQRGESDASRKAHPVANIAGEVGGAIVSPVNKIKIAAQGGRAVRMAAAAVPDAVYGLLYGAGQSDAKTIGGQATDALKSGAAAVAGGVIGRGVVKAGSRLLAPVVNPAVRKLADLGVTMTPGQIIGGTAKKLEDKVSSVPGLGEVVGAARRRGINQFNSAVLNKSLAPIGLKLPKGVSGQKAQAFTKQAYDAAYDAARSGMHVEDSPQFRKGVTDLVDKANMGGLESLSPEYAKRFEAVVDGDVFRRFESGRLSGDGFKRLISSLKETATKYSAGNNDVNAQEYGRALGELADHIDDAAKQVSDPAAVALMNKADEGYGILATAQNAARQRGGEPGMFTPTQFDRAVQKGDKSARNNAYLSGNARMQDVSGAGMEVLPSTVPDSGTAGRLAVTGAFGAGGAVNPFTAPFVAKAALASVPYIPGIDKGIQKLLIERPDLLKKLGGQLGKRSYLGGLIGAPIGADLATGK